MRSLGSSPLTRGKLPPRSARGRRRGLIPAHAGKTCFRRSVWRRGPAHPRSRGENLFSPFSLATRAGSSPLTRGKRPGCARSRMARRLIPAHAGKTKSTRLPASTPPAHPRSRGENHNRPRSQFMHSGSSPLTRGKRVHRRHTPPDRRLIPAHAGKTRPIFLYRTPMRAHPRSRGENASFCGRRRLSRGSSPLTRGKHMPSRVTPKQQRLIPAHAGKTARQGPGSLSPRAHPRSRGENLHLVGTRLEDGGSSPLTRGKPALTAFAPATPRLIPAHAGKTFIWSAPDLKTAAHPRSRGENRRSRPSHLRRRGSSPLTRGKPSSGRHPT